MRGAWLVWVVSWFGAAWWSERTVARPAVGRELVYRLLTASGAALLFGLRPRRLSRLALWQLASGGAWLSVGVTIAGLLFTWWARIHLGRLWSGHITRKHGHTVVDTGPYGLVRHPIYFGVTTAALGTAALRGNALALIGVALMIAGFYVKARLEEHFLREQLGAVEYDAYARRVPMLVPFARSRGICPRRSASS